MSVWRGESGSALTHADLLECDEFVKYVLGVLDGSIRTLNIYVTYREVLGVKRKNPELLGRIESRSSWQWLNLVNHAYFLQSVPIVNRALPFRASKSSCVQYIREQAAAGVGGFAS